MCGAGRKSKTRLDTYSKFSNQGASVSITEKMIENQILQYLSIKRIFSFKINSTGVFDPRQGRFLKSRNKHHINGISDIMGVVNDGSGRILAIECKKPYLSKKTNQFKYRTQEELENLASAEQVLFINNIKKSGGIAFYADTIGVVEDQLKLYGVIKV